MTSWRTVAWPTAVSTFTDGGAARSFVQVVGDRPRRAAVLADDQGRDALRDLAGGVGLGEQALGGVIVRVDEPRRQHQPAGVDDALARARLQIADGRDAAVDHAHRRRACRGAGAVDEPGVRSRGTTRADWATGRRPAASGASGGTTGRISRDGCAASCRMVCSAFCTAASSPKTPPVFGLRSKRGKLLLDTSSRMRWPALKRFDVAPRSIVISVGSPGVSSAWRRRPVPIARPQDAVGQRASRAVREDVHELAGEVRVARARRHPQRQRERAGDLEVRARAARVV